MKSINLLLLALLVSASFTTAFAGEETDYKNMEQMLGAVRLEKRQVENMLDKMIVSGRISAEEGAKVKRELASVKDDDMENLKKQAIAEVKNRHRSPASEH